MRLQAKVAALLLPLAVIAAGCGGGASSTSPAPKAKATTASTSSAAPSSATPVKGGTLTVGFWQEPDTLNPAQTGLIAVGEIDRNVFDTLTWLTSTGKVTPDLATSWTVSPDGKTYTFQLRQGVKFTDGTPFNAKAVVANFNYIEAPSTHSISAVGALGPFESAKATGTYTVVVTLKKPYGWFLTNLGEDFLGMQSPTAIAKEGKQYGLKPVGTGPFMVQQFVPNSKVVLVRNPDYNWAPAAEGRQGPAYLSQLVYDIVQTSQSRADELQSGQAQIVEQAPALAYKTMKASGQYNSMVVPTPGSGTYAVFNNSKFPTNDVNVRKAILYYTDRAGLTKLADQGVYPVVWGPLQPGTIGYDPAFNNMYAYDPAKGAQTLTADGWSKVKGIWTKNGKPLSLVITNPSGVLDLPALSQAIQGYLQKAGMQVKIEQFADAAWHASNVKGVENIMPLAFSGLTPDLLRIEFTPPQYFDWSKYNNPKVTSLVENALSVTNATKRLAMYEQAEQILMQDAAMLPIHELSNLMLLNKSVQGVSIYIGGQPNYYSTWLSH